ncbi:MAG: DUF1015 domain-containing protein [Armatimonadota bacterium]
MPTVRPFPALRYNTTRFPDLAPLLAPPYDVIAPEEQQALYGRDPHNVIRLEYGLQEAGDSEANNRYTRAKATLAEWLAEGVLVMDQAPAFYPHRQQFTWQGQAYSRLGMYAAVKLQPFNEGEILPHELTLKGPKIDRLNLMRACLTSFSPVLALYDGRDSEIGAALHRATAGAPQATAKGFGFAEELWQAADTGITNTIADALQQRKILIADGHHRYETVLGLRDLLREEFPGFSTGTAFNYAFMLLVDIQDPGLLVLPTHRLLMLTPEMLDAFPRIAGESFDVKDVQVTQPDQVTDLLARHTDEHAFIVYTGGRYLLLTSPRETRDGLPVLDVVTLQEQLIDPLLQQGEGSVENNVRYTTKPADAVARVDNGEIQAAVFLNATPVLDVLQLAEHGIRVPQKSTYFYPKAPTGLVMYNLRPEVSVG